MSSVNVSYILMQIEDDLSVDKIVDDLLQIEPTCVNLFLQEQSPF